jgi:hypothetical protein
MEANRCNSLGSCPAGTPPCFDSAYTPPIVEVPQSTGAFSLIGGFVYRGALLPGEIGKYFFADFFDDKIRSLNYDGPSGVVSNLQDRTAELTPSVGAIRNIASFGIDGFGELLIVDHTASGNGEIYKMVPSGAAQSNAVVNNGAGINPVSYMPLSLPILGNVYQSSIDVSAHPGGATFTAVFGFTGTNSLVIPAGELLLSGSNVFGFSQASSGGLDLFENSVPVNLALNGATVHTQAFSIGAGNTVAYNGVSLTVGMF